MSNTSEWRRAEERLIRSCDWVKWIDAGMEVVVGTREVGITEVRVVRPHQIPSAVWISRTLGPDVW